MRWSESQPFFSATLVPGASGAARRRCRRRRCDEASTRSASVACRRVRPSRVERTPVAVRAGVQAVEGATEVARGRHARVRAGRPLPHRGGRAVRAGVRARGHPEPAQPVGDGAVAELPGDPVRGEIRRPGPELARVVPPAAPLGAGRRAVAATSAPSFTVDAAAKRVSASNAGVAPGVELVHPDAGDAVEACRCPARAPGRAPDRLAAGRPGRRGRQRSRAAPCSSSPAGRSSCSAQRTWRGRGRAGRPAAREEPGAPSRQRAPPRRGRVRPRSRPGAPSGVAGYESCARGR